MVIALIASRYANLSHFKQKYRNHWSKRVRCRLRDFAGSDAVGFSQYFRHSDSILQQLPGWLDLEQVSVPARKSGSPRPKLSLSPA